jgi:hypothetical protein
MPVFRGNKPNQCETLQAGQDELKQAAASFAHLLTRFCQNASIFHFWQGTMPVLCENMLNQSETMQADPDKLKEAAASISHPSVRRCQNAFIFHFRYHPLACMASAPWKDIESV